MPKRIVICFDGTWNTPSESFAGLKSLHDRFASLTGRPKAAVADALESVEAAGGVETNVCRFYRSVRRLTAAQAPDGIAQVKWYDQGVGTEWYNRVRGGAFGIGLSRNIREGYRNLSQVWEEGDEVFILGFSRGAYTARSLVGMVRNCGLLPKALTAGEPDGPEIMEAYEIYRTRDGSADFPERAITYRKRKNAPIIPIKFLGVWDTVGALGVPVQSFEEFNREQFQFHYTELSRHRRERLSRHRRSTSTASPTRRPLWDPKEKPRPDHRAALVRRRACRCRRRLREPSSLGHCARMDAAEGAGVRPPPRPERHCRGEAGERCRRACWISSARSSAASSASSMSAITALSASACTVRK